MEAVGQTLRKNRTRLVTLAVLAFLFFTAIQGMETSDWTITLLRGLSVGAVTFLVAAGLSLIFGLMDVLNLAHGELFMIGAYAGWTVYVRPDTFVDLLTPVALVAVGLTLWPLWHALQAGRGRQPSRVWLWVALAGAVVLLWFGLTRYPTAIWDHEVYAESPITYSLALDQGLLNLPAPPDFEASPFLVLGALLLGGIGLAVALVGFSRRGQPAGGDTTISRTPLLAGALLLALGLAALIFNVPLTDWLLNMSSTLRFFVAMAVAAVVGVLLGAFIEVTMIRPLYARPMYQIMLTLGLSFIGIEAVRAVWGRPEFTFPKPALWDASGEGCPATGLGGWLENQCSTILLFDGRVRTYNEVFIIFVGLVVLIGIWLLLQRTRIGMIIRAGVQDSEMVEALGINVRQVFTLVFALGVGLAAMGGVLAAPSIGLSNDMGTRLLLLALIALAIGGLTSFPGAAAGAVLVGLVQQFIIKYGQLGINLPFLEEPFKPSPPLVPASVVLLMVIILLVLPQGLFGRSE